MRLMSQSTDIRVEGGRLYFLPLRMRVPLKFGAETVESVTCARVCLRVRLESGKRAEGWGETPLSVQWVWPSGLPSEFRHTALKEFCVELLREWNEWEARGHALEVGHDFIEERLPEVLAEFNGRRTGEAMPWLAALVCCSAFDLALHDAYGEVHGRPVYETYTREFLNGDLSRWLEPAAGSRVSFAGKYPEDYLVARPPVRLEAWHLVGGKDPIAASELTGGEPQDGYPVLLEDWIRQDGLKCIKIKLRGNEGAWDYERLLAVGRMAIKHDVSWLTADFNCTVTEPDYVNEILDRLLREEPRIYGMILYVEQPFPYDLELYQIDVRSVAARKPLFMDESAHDWKFVRLGRSLGWTGVALKTCKTQTGALLSLCWAKAHGMTLMVQDLTNPMLAQISHVQLAARAGTIMGVETNAMQFYPDASLPEAEVHPGLYQRRKGMVDLSTIEGPGFGYGLARIRRELPEPIAQF